MRIGKNELQVMALLEEHKGMTKKKLRKRFNPKGCSSRESERVALSRALSRLTDKGLIRKYAKIDEFDRWDPEWTRRKPMIVSQPYDGTMRGPYIEVILDLTEKGQTELYDREDRWKHESR